MKSAKLLFGILLMAIVFAAGCVGGKSDTPQLAAPTGESINVDTSAINEELNGIDAEQSELTENITESDLDLGI